MLICKVYNAWAGKLAKYAAPRVLKTFVGLVTLVTGSGMNYKTLLRSEAEKNGSPMMHPKKYAGILLFSVHIFLEAYGSAQTFAVPEPPQVWARNHVVSLTIDAFNENGRDAFAFEGETVAPVIRASPGDTLRITYINNLPPKSAETCAINPCMDMTNLHFHGLTVSPDAPQDDVLTMLAKPGQVLHYSVAIPRNHPPGLFWYHTHPHGESHRQVLDGMSGAIVIEGMERYVPEVSQLRERVIVVRRPLHRA